MKLSADWSAILEGSPTEVYVVELEHGRVLWANQQACVNLGYPLEELVGLGPDALNAQIDQQTAEAMMREFVVTAGPNLLVTEHVRKDGTTYPVEIRLQLAELEGRPVAVSMATDVTERVRVERQLAEANRMLQAVLDTIPVRVFWKDLALNYLGCNQLFARDAGLEDPSQLIGHDDYEMGWRKEADLYRADDRKVIESGQPRLNYEEPQTTPAGETIWLKTSKIPLRDTDDRVVGVLGTYEDVTPRRRAEEALQASEQKYREYISRAPTGVGVVDGQGRFIEVNEALCAQTGYDAPELLTFSIRDVLAPRSMDEGLSAFSRVMSDGEYSGELALRHADGREVWISFNAARLSEDRMVGFTQDITERREMERRLRHSQKMEAIGGLAGGVAHDFNNMLMPIMGAASMLERRLEEPKARRYAGIISKAAARAAEMTRQLLAFARRAPACVEPFDLHQLIGDVVVLLEHSIDKRIDIECRLGAARAAVNGDKSQFHNVLLNLAVNARDAMPRGGTLTFATGQRSLAPEQARDWGLPAGDYLELCVRDTGEGMSEELLTRVFEPFFTTKGEGKGTGMGLASVYGTIKEHDGAIRVDSALGAGTSFTMLLPASDRPVAMVAPQRPGEDTLAARILVVEDEPLVREVIAEMLEQAGHRPRCIGTPEEAVAYYRDHQREIDLVILDLVMPGMSGEEVFHALREIDPQAPVLLASGYSQATVAQRLITSGALGFLRKPYTPEELLAMISGALRRPDA